MLHTVGMHRLSQSRHGSLNTSFSNWRNIRKNCKQRSNFVNREKSLTFQSFWYLKNFLVHVFYEKIIDFFFIYKKVHWWTRIKMNVINFGLNNFLHKEKLFIGFRSIDGNELCFDDNWSVCVVIFWLFSTFCGKTFFFVANVFLLQ